MEHPVVVEPERLPRQQKNLLKVVAPLPLTSHKSARFSLKPPGVFDLQEAFFISRDNTSQISAEEFPKKDAIQHK